MSEQREGLFSGVQVVENSMLPPNTMVVSPDIYAMLRGLDSPPSVEAKVKLLSDLLKNLNGGK